MNSLKKFIAVFALFLMLCGCGRKALFEGVIHYRHQLESCSPRYPLGILMNTMDTASAYYYKNGNYKWVNAGSLFKEDLYLADENRNYFKVGADVYYGDGAEVSEDVLSFSMEKEVMKVAGYHCDLLQLTTRSRKDNSIVYRDIFYSPDIRIDSAAFSRLKYLSHDFIAAQTHSLPLRIDMYNEEFSIVWQAESVEFRALPDSLFKIRGMDNAKPVNRLSF